MSFIEDMFQDYFDSTGIVGDEDAYWDDDEWNYDMSVAERRQRPSYPGDTDWRYEKGGVFHDD